MNEQAFFNSLTIGWFSLAVVVFLALLFVAAPYGRYARGGWGPTVSNKLGWVIMEAAAPLVFAVCFVLGSDANTLTTLVFLGLWEVHYIHRAFIYPFGRRSRHRGMPLTIVSFGLLFNTLNAYLNGRYIFTFSSRSVSILSKSLMTLALSPQEANLIAFVQEQGKVRLTMRSPADAKVEPMTPASWESLFQYIAPQKQGDNLPAADTTEYVEVLRGLNKEKVPLSK